MQQINVLEASTLNTKYRQYNLRFCDAFYECKKIILQFEENTINKTLSSLELILKTFSLRATTQKPAKFANLYY